MILVRLKPQMRTIGLVVKRKQYTEHLRQIKFIH